MIGVGFGYELIHWEEEFSMKYELLPLCVFHFLVSGISLFAIDYIVVRKEHLKMYIIDISFDIIIGYWIVMNYIH